MHHKSNNDIHLNSTRSFRGVRINMEKYKFTFGDYLDIVRMSINERHKKIPNYLMLQNYIHVRI